MDPSGLAATVRTSVVAVNVEHYVSIMFQTSVRPVGRKPSNVNVNLKFRAFAVTSSGGAVAVKLRRPEKLGENNNDPLNEMFLGTLCPGSDTYTGLYFDNNELRDSFGSPYEKLVITATVSGTSEKGQVLEMSHAQEMIYLVYQIRRDGTIDENPVFNYSPYRAEGLSPNPGNVIPPHRGLPAPEGRTPPNN